MSKVGNTGVCGINDFDKKMCHCNGPNLKIDVMLWFFTCLGYFFLKKRSLLEIHCMHFGLRRRFHITFLTAIKSDETKK